MRIYITHCSAKKNDNLKNSGMQVTPDNLYTANPLQRFIKKCKIKKANWAIFSDLYGIFFPDDRHEWYNKHPSCVTEKEFVNLLNDFDAKLQGYEEIWFYYNPGRCHPLYCRLINESKLKKRIKKFTHIREIQ